MSYAVSGVGLIDRAVLEALADLGGTPGSLRPVRSSAVCELVEERSGIGLDTAYRALVTLTHSWERHLLLVDPRGNFGTPEGDPPAAARYTSARLTKVGELVLRSEQAGVSLPIGLIEGNMPTQGRRPAFDPYRILDAVEAVIRHPTITDEDLLAHAGGPVFPTGCEVIGDVDALIRGEEADLVFRARVGAIEWKGGVCVRIDHLPPGASSQEVAMAIKDRVERPLPGHPRLQAAMLPVRSLDFERDALVVTPNDDADLEELTVKLWTLPGVTTDWRRLRLSGPLNQLLRSAAASAPAEELLAAISEVRAALP